MVWSWLVNWGWFIYRGRVIYGLVNRGWMIHRCWFVYWSGMITWSGFVNWSWSSISLIRYIGDVTSIVISGVLDVLSSAVRKQNRIMSIYITSIGIFSGFEIGSSVIVAYTISIMVWSGLVFWLMIRRCWFIRWSWGMISWGVVGWCWCMISWWACRCGTCASDKD